MYMHGLPANCPIGAEFGFQLSHDYWQHNNLITTWNNKCYWDVIGKDQGLIDLAFTMFGA